MFDFLSPNLISGMASSMLMNGIKGLMGGQPQQPQAQSPVAAAMGLPPPKAIHMTPPMMLGPTTTAYLADGGIAGIPQPPPGESPSMASAMDKGGMIRGPGGGVADLIGGMIDNRQKVLLSDGEFVVPARVVSALGDGSSEAGAKVLHGMISRVKQEAGKKLKDNGEINLKKVLPA